MVRIRVEKRDITTNNETIQTKYFKNLYSIKLENLKEMIIFCIGAIYQGEIKIDKHFKQIYICPSEIEGTIEIK